MKAAGMMEFSAVMGVLKAIAVVLAALASMLGAQHGTPELSSPPNATGVVTVPAPTPTPIPTSVSPTPEPTSTTLPVPAPPDEVAPAPTAPDPIEPTGPPLADPTPSGPSGAGELLWSQDFESGTETRMAAQDRSGIPAEVVNDPAGARGGSHAMKFTLTAGVGGDQYGQRSERVPDIPDQQEGDELYFALSTKLAAGFPIDDGWQVLTNWHSAMDGSPPIELDVQYGQYQLTGGSADPEGAEPYSMQLGAPVTETWVDWVFHIKFSTDPSVGFVEVWKDGQVLVPKFQPATATMYDAVDYWKFGYYRSFDVGADGSVYYDNLKVGTSMSAVTS